MSTAKPIPHHLLHSEVKNSLCLGHAHLVVMEREIPLSLQHAHVPQIIVLKLKWSQTPCIGPKFNPHRKRAHALKKDLTISNRSLQGGPLAMIPRGILRQVTRHHIIHQPAQVMSLPVQQVILVPVRMIRHPFILPQVTRQLAIQQPVQAMPLPIRVIDPPPILPWIIHHRSNTQMDLQKHILTTLLESTPHPQN